MTTLHLNLKKKWFDMFLAGIKKEEYRELNHYWFKRIVFNHKKVNQFYNVHTDLGVKNLFSNPLLAKSIAFKPIDTITFSNGYAKDRPQFVIELKGIEIREGKPEWGAEPRKKYFVLKTGQILSGGIDWEQKELASRIEHSNEYFIDGFVHGVKKYEAIGVYTVSGNELEEVRDIEEV
ncbi:hypothetical protein [Leeuwenhoekiella sp. MAR_2009_132]|uniref:hypothetical protein n=1 Tax=Leeuwenhoekiella sp. MAR_2009_132 TaxID=1392489 RepID=UPI0006903D32|nr:hypothetical protein [Leeuwenhoekiella sp. MAR_2009_132]